MISSEFEFFVGFDVFSESNLGGMIVKLERGRIQQNELFDIVGVFDRVGGRRVAAHGNPDKVELIRINCAGTQAGQTSAYLWSSPGSDSAFPPCPARSVRMR